MKYKDILALSRKEMNPSIDRLVSVFKDIVLCYPKGIKLTFSEETVDTIIPLLDEEEIPAYRVNAKDIVIASSYTALVSFVTDNALDYDVNYE